MKSYSLDLRSKIVTAHLVEKMSIRNVASRFGVTKSLVQKLVNPQQTRGNLLPKKRGNPASALTANAKVEIRALVAEYRDATLIELSELLLQRTGNWVSQTALWRYLQKLGLNRKKKHGTVAFAGTERVQKLRVKYWEKIKKVEVQNLVFLDETGIMHSFG